MPLPPEPLGNGRCPLHLPPGQHPRRPVKSQAWAEDKREDLRQLEAELGMGSRPTHSHWAAKLKRRQPGKAQ